MVRMGLISQNINKDNKEHMLFFSLLDKKRVFFYHNRMVKHKQEFLDRMKNQLNNEYEAFIKSYECESVRGVRVNTKKIYTADYLKISPFALEPISYCDNGFIVESDEKWGKHPYHHAGLIYFQEPSSMVPVCSVNVLEDDLVIDLCAAPGGKSGQIACKLG